MATARRRNWEAALGPLVAVAGFVSYFAVFYRWPVLRDVPWLNYALLVAAVALSLRGVHSAWSRGGALRRGLALLGLGASAAVALFFAWYTLSASRELPDASRGLALGAPLPQLALLDHTGARVELASLSEPLVLVFYRGHW
jgi:hypothetical protein